MSQEGGKAAYPESLLDAPAVEASPKAALDELMDRYARGDDAALDELYRVGAPRVRAFLTRLCADLALAEDLTQDAFMRVGRARGTFVTGAAAFPWIMAIARNAFRDHVRRERVRRTNSESPERLENPTTQTFSQDGGDRALIARELLGEVEQALMGLPVRQREAFILIRFEGLSVSEAAQVLGATQAAVKILVHRAYTAVRASIATENPERSFGRRPLSRAP
ncbi:MAG: RNA polymerase sigma factor [Polyangiaceae bacterium]|jgi:RNA polymerase sigma-70 factor (ECF subfamily)